MFHWQQHIREHVKVNKPELGSKTIGGTAKMYADDSCVSPLTRFLEIQKLKRSQIAVAVDAHLFNHTEDCGFKFRWSRIYSGFTFCRLSWAQNIVLFATRYIRCKSAQKKLSVNCGRVRKNNQLKNRPCPSWGVAPDRRRRRQKRLCKDLSVTRVFSSKMIYVVKFVRDCCYR